MARDLGWIYASIWADDDFVALTPGAQRLYLFLLTQADLSHAGLIAMRPRRWATRAHGLDPEDLTTQLDELEAHRFVVTDPDTEEVLVRSFIRGDGVWKRPNVMKAAVKDSREILSPRLRTALIDELDRIPLDELPDEPGRNGAPSARAVVTSCVETLLHELADDRANNPSQNPSGNRSENRSRKGSANGFGNPSRARGPSPYPSPSPSPGEDPSSAIAAAIPDVDDDPRPEIVELCEHLADRIEANGSRRPRIGKRWHTACRLLLDADGRTVDQVRAAIDWSQNDEFWRANVLSMPTLREKYDQLRLAASRSRGPAADRHLDSLRDGIAWAQQHDQANAAADDTTTAPARLAIGAP